jgi:SP family arabinose:H+ symporter-like MFS transporter
MVLQLIFVWKIMPETKGKSLEQIEHTLTMH